MKKLRPYYVSEEVLAKSGGIADPEDISKVKRDFVGFDLDDLGRPLNPLGRTGIAGRGGIYRWGESSTVDAVMIKNALTKPELLVIEKNAKPKPALPGGFVELGERKDEATVREVVEETTLRPEGTTQWIGSLITRSRRTTDHAWIRTNGFLNIVGRRHSAFNKEPQGKDDADEAYWALLTTELISGMSIRHRILVEAACDMAEIAIRNAS
jgi:ADP-ribose pyrophosphatase